MVITLGGRAQAPPLKGARPAGAGRSIRPPPAVCLRIARSSDDFARTAIRAFHERPARGVIKCEEFRSRCGVEPKPRVVTRTREELIIFKNDRQAGTIRGLVHAHVRSLDRYRHVPVL